MTLYQDVFYETSDGLSLYARDYPGPTAGAPVVMCLHGLTRNSRDFHDLALTLSGTFRVLVPEQRGRGRSDYDSDSSRYAIMQYVADMHGLLNKLNVETVAIVGTSMGGLMTFALNALYPGLITRAVINDIGPEIAETGLERIKSYVGVAGPFASWDEAIRYLKDVSADIFPRWAENQWADFARQCYREHDGQVVIDYDPRIADPLARESDDTEAQTLWSLFEVMATVPTLLVRGALTDLLSVSCVERMQALHPTMELLTVPDVGHAPTLNETGVAAAINAFLSR